MRKLRSLFLNRSVPKSKIWGWVKFMINGINLDNAHLHGSCAIYLQLANCKYKISGRGNLSRVIGYSPDLVSYCCCLWMDVVVMTPLVWLPAGRTQKCSSLVEAFCEEWVLTKNISCFLSLILFTMKFSLKAANSMSVTYKMPRKFICIS